MPFESEAQRRWMYANHPAMAAKWQAHTPKGKHLPKHVKHKHKHKQDAVKKAAHILNQPDLLEQVLRYTRAALVSRPTDLP